MSDQTLRSGLIRLAHTNPELRGELLPLLTKRAEYGVKPTESELQSMQEIIHVWGKALAAALGGQASVVGQSSASQIIMAVTLPDLAPNATIRAHVGLLKGEFVVGMFEWGVPSFVKEALGRDWLVAYRYSGTPEEVMRAAAPAAKEVARTLEPVREQAGLRRDADADFGQVVPKLHAWVQKALSPFAVAGPMRVSGSLHVEITGQGIPYAKGTLYISGLISRADAKNKNHAEMVLEKFNDVLARALPHFNHDGVVATLAPERAGFTADLYQVPVVLYFKKSPVRLAAGQPNYTAFTSRVAAAAPLFTEAEQILHDVAALAASQLGGKVVDVSGFGLSGIYDSDGNPKTNYASGSASVNLPKLPDFRAAGTATLEIRVSADTDDGAVDVMVYVSGTIKTVDAAFTKVMRDKQLSGAPDQVRSKLRGWIGTIRTVLEGDFVRGAVVQQALPALKKAEADLKQMLDGVVTRLGGELSHLHQSHPARLVGEIVVETVSVGLKGLLSVPDRETARSSAGAARQALVEACKSFRSGNMRAMVSSQPGYWSSYEFEVNLHIYQGDTAPVVSRVAAAGIPVTLKKKLTLKDRTVIEEGEKGTLRFDEAKPTGVVVDFDVRPNTRLGTRLLGDYFGRPFMKEPSMKALENMGDGIAKSVTGKKVEPDGYGPDGSPSWLLALGLI